MLCVKASLISERLLSNEDKQDMLNGLIPIESLIAHVKAWQDTGMRIYADGSGLRYTPLNEKPMSRYRGRVDR